MINYVNVKNYTLIYERISYILTVSMSLMKIKLKNSNNHLFFDDKNLVENLITSYLRNLE